MLYRCLLFVCFFIESIFKSSFTNMQLTTLRHQILAYKLISKNMPLPPNLQQALLSPTQQSPTSIATPVNDRSATTTTTTTMDMNSNLDNSKSGSYESIQEDSGKELNAYASPYTLIHRSTHTSSNRLRPHHQRLLVPSITPFGMDSYSIITERERRMQARIKYRMNELEKLPSNLVDHGSQNMWSVQQENPHHGSAKLRAVIELKSLRLLSKQKKVNEKKSGWFTISWYLTFFFLTCDI